MCTSDSKRKAVDDPTTPSANKRVKSSHSDSPEPKKIQALPAHPVPFPEKVSLHPPHQDNGRPEWNMLATVPYMRRTPKLTS